MGFLNNLGPVLPYQQSTTYQEDLKREAVKQFQRIYDKFIDKRMACQELLWGDEIEYQIVHFDHPNRKVRLQCNTQHVFQGHAKINQQEYDCLSEEDKSRKWNDYFQSMLEYGSWMVEAIPMNPYNVTCSMDPVRQNLKVRNTTYRGLMKPDEAALCMTHFPMMGMADYYIPNQDMQHHPDDQPETRQLKEDLHQNIFGQSDYFADETITNHPRFRHLSQNIRERRGEKVGIEQPVFQDVNTTEKTHCVDHMGFGMGMGCMQQTFATLDIDCCRHLYDQLSVFSPLMLAFTAATPILHGRLIDQDTRWNMIAQSVDCRSAQERDPTTQSYIPKSRYDSISYFIGNTPLFQPEYNDIDFNRNLDPVTKFRKNSYDSGLGLDANLQSHLGFLLARDQMVIFEREIQSKNYDMSFEQFNSTNWNNVRFKPQPHLDAEHMAWRHQIEFRTMELQPTETENLFSLQLVKLIAQMLMCKINPNPLNFYIPISLVDANFKRASLPNALLQEKFYFRTNVFEAGPPTILQLSIYDYLCGSVHFQGIMPIILKFLQQNETQQSEMEEVLKLAQFVKDRCSGKIPTTAQFIRQFVRSHPEYKQDSLLTDGITYDLLLKMLHIQNNDLFHYP